MCSCNIFQSLSKINLLRIDKWKLRTLYQIALFSEEAPKKKERKRRTKTHLDELNEYLSSEKHLLEIKDKLPERCLKKNRKTPDDLYLIDRKVGERIADVVLPHIKKSTGVMIETNSGFGFITESLIKADLSLLHVYEPTVVFREHLFSIHKRYPDKIKLYNKDFFSIWKLSYQDKYDNGNRVKNMLSGVPPRDWTDDVAMNIIGILPNPNFIRHLILSLVFQYGIMTYGRSDLYICIPPFLYLQWTAKPEDSFQLYRASSVLLQIFCNFELLEKVPRKSFLPWDSLQEIKKYSKRKYPHYFIDTDFMYLTKISFKKPLPVPVEKLHALWYFVRHLMVSRKNKIIPMLEKWIPECGWNIIAMDPLQNPDLYPNINIFTKIGDLTPQQILYLFKLFSSWPEYNDSPFIATMESAILKMEQGTELDVMIKEDSPEPEPESETEIKENVHN